MQVCQCEARSHERMNLSFSFSTGPWQFSNSRNLWPYFTVSNPRWSEPVGPSSTLYMSEKHGDPNFIPDTGCRLLWMVKFRRIYSSPPPRGVWTFQVIILYFGIPLHASLLFTLKYSPSCNLSLKWCVLHVHAHQHRGNKAYHNSSHTKCNTEKTKIASSRLLQHT
jgi:hypothetical protein